MFGSYFFDDMFSSISFLFSDPSRIALGWDSAGYGLYTSGYSVLCVFGGLIICGILLDKWGVRITGSIFVGLMTAGAALVLWAITSGLTPKQSLTVAYIGCMLFGLGSEIAGVAVTRSIARWFKDGPMAFAMGLQLAIARLGTAFALVMAPKLVPEKTCQEAYTLAETSRPAMLGLALLLLGCILWGVFVALDAKRFPSGKDEAKSDEFHFSDILKVLTNKRFIIISLLCVFFYSSIIAFKKFAGAILVPRFDVPAEAASWMVSMLPFATVIFAPLFGILVDKLGHGTRWMLIGAVLALTAHLLLAFAALEILLCGSMTRKVLTTALLIPVLSRICSGLTAELLPKARRSGMLSDMVGRKTERGKVIILSLQLIACASVLLAADLISGGILLAAEGILILYYRHMALAEFGGVTGDLAGWYLCMAELAGAWALAAAGWIR